MKLPLICALLVVSSTTVFAGDQAKSPKQEQEQGQEREQEAAAKTESDFQDLVFFGLEHPYVIRIHIRVDQAGFRDAWNSHTTKFFGELDLNGDGWLSTAEAQHIDAQNIIPDKSFFEKLFSAGKAQTRKLPADAGKQDGKVTRDELAAYLKQSGNGPFKIRSNANAARGDKSSSEGLQNRIDLNSDEKLSQRELERAPIVLKPLDVDDDEIIALGELTKGGYRYSRAAYGSAANGNKFFAPLQQDKLNSLVKRVRKTYGTKADNKGDDKDDESAEPRLLNRHTLGWNEEFFAKYDKDADGTLDDGELRKYLQTPTPAIELIFLRGSKEKTQSRIEIMRIETAIVPSKNIHTFGDNFVLLDFGRDKLEFQADAAGNSTGGASNNFASSEETVGELRHG